MPKSAETLALENLLFIYNAMNSFFCIFECTLGFGGGGRVDCISINTKGTIRCYEIKVTKSDFHSKHGHNFIGHLNYYVMPQKLYNEVKAEIPYDIGVMCPVHNELKIIKSARKKQCRHVEDIKLYMIRSLFREYEKNFNSSNVQLFETYKKESAAQKKRAQKAENALLVLNHNIREYLGKDYRKFHNWLRERY